MKKKRSIKMLLCGLSAFIILVLSCSFSYCQEAEKEILTEKARLSKGKNLLSSLRSAAVAYLAQYRRTPKRGEEDVLYRYVDIDVDSLRYFSFSLPETSEVDPPENTTIVYVIRNEQDMPHNYKAYTLCIDLRGASWCAGDEKTCQQLDLPTSQP